MQLANGVHHLAFCTKDMKGQLQFFNEMLGLELTGLFWMHGVEGAWHAFMTLDHSCYLSFVQMPQIVELEPQLGLTHSGNGANPSAPGTLQHLAFNVDTEQDLLNLRDRLRSKGLHVFGPIDHGMCKSIYFAGLEDLTLEIATSEEALDGRAWVDPEVAALMGLDDEELGRLRKPEPFAGQGGAVPQPPLESGQPRMRGYPERLYAAMVGMSDEQISASSYTDPPVRIEED